MNRTTAKFIAIGVFVTALVAAFAITLTGLNRADDDEAVVASTQTIMFSQLGMG